MPVFTSRISSSSGVASPSLLGLDHALDRAVGAAHHAAVAGGVVEHRRHHRRRRAALRVRRDQLCDRLGADQRHVAAEDTHRRVRLEAAPSELRPSPPRPRRRCRSARGCTASSTPSGSTPASARAGESTTTTRSAPPPAPRAPATAASAGRTARAAPSACCERMRVPWPAARIRTVGALTQRMLVPPAGAHAPREPRRHARLGGRDSNPDSQDQNLMSCHWTTPQGDPHRRTRARAASARRRSTSAELHESLHSVARVRAIGKEASALQCERSSGRYARCAGARRRALPPRSAARPRDRTPASSGAGARTPTSRPDRRQRSACVDAADAVSDQPGRAPPIACARCAPTANCQAVAGAQVARHGALRLLRRRQPLRADTRWRCIAKLPYPRARVSLVDRRRTSAGAPAAAATPAQIVAAWMRIAAAPGNDPRRACTAKSASASRPRCPSRPRARRAARRDLRGRVRGPRLTRALSSGTPARARAGTRPAFGAGLQRGPARGGDAEHAHRLQAEARASRVRRSS